MHIGSEKGLSVSTPHCGISNRKLQAIIYSLPSKDKPVARNSSVTGRTSRLNSTEPNAKISVSMNKSQKNLFVSHPNITAKSSLFADRQSHSRDHKMNQSQKVKSMAQSGFAHQKPPNAAPKQRPNLGCSSLFKLPTNKLLNNSRHVRKLSNENMEKSAFAAANRLRSKKQLVVNTKPPSPFAFERLKTLRYKVEFSRPNFTKIAALKPPLTIDKKTIKKNQLFESKPHQTKVRIKTEPVLQTVASGKVASDSAFEFIVYSANKLLEFAEQFVAKERRIAFNYLLDGAFQKFQKDDLIEFMDLKEPVAETEAETFFRIVRPREFQETLLSLAREFCDMRNVTIEKIVESARVV